MELELTGRTAIVTGAGRGIGRQIAHRLGHEGCAVVVADIDEPRAKTVSKEIVEDGGKAVALVCDVTDRNEVTAMVDEASRTFGAVGVLVNNAGIPAQAEDDPGPAIARFRFAESDPDAWPKIMDVITKGVLNCCHGVLPTMIEEGWGRIVNIASDAGRIGEPSLACYSMAKAGVIGFSKAIAKEVGRHRITVNCVSPAFVTTDATADRFRDLGEKILKRYPMAAGLQRLGNADDVADTVAYLTSERAEWITGQVLSVNGGYSMVS